VPVPPGECHYSMGHILCQLCCERSLPWRCHREKAHATVLDQLRSTAIVPPMAKNIRHDTTEPNGCQALRPRLPSCRRTYMLIYTMYARTSRIRGLHERAAADKNKELCQFIVKRTSRFLICESETD